MAVARAPLSAPFVSRELNGEHLLDELAELRTAQVPHKQLEELVRAVGELEGTRASEASARLKQIAQGRFSSHPALAASLVRWAGKLKSDADVGALMSHLERLALVSALLGAFRRGADRLPRSSRP